MSWLDDTLEETGHAIRMRKDLAYFARHALKIRTKEGGPLQPFIFNAAQTKLHDALELQRQEKGRVRAILLKGRQMGSSTYVGARFYHRTVMTRGLRTIIIAHEKPASAALYEMVKRFHENMPDELRPDTSTANAQSLIFDKLDSGYIVEIADEDGAGRSQTAQLLHASEVAFWKNLQGQMTALMQTVPDLPGTEIILETTACGFNAFQKLWAKTEAGLGDFIPIFLPWTLDPGYSRPVPEDFAMTAEEREIAALHGLTPGQIAFRRGKIETEFYDEPARFAQEYPLSPNEAFIDSDFDSYIPGGLVMRARKETALEPYGPLIVGVDPAGMGPDRTSIAWRRGRCITKIESRKGMDTMAVAGWVLSIINNEKPDRVNIDVGGLGVGVYDRLREQGVKASVLQAVNFGGRPVEPPPLDEAGNPAGGYANRRAEMWANMKKALQGRFRLPDRDSLHTDLTTPGYKFTSDNKLQLESKQEIRKRGLPSPDEADACALCFADPEGFIRRSDFNRKIEYAGEAFV